MIEFYHQTACKQTIFILIFDSVTFLGVLYTLFLLHFFFNFQGKASLSFASFVKFVMRVSGYFIFIFLVLTPQMHYFLFSSFVLIMLMEKKKPNQKMLWCICYQHRIYQFWTNRNSFSKKGKNDNSVGLTVYHHVTNHSGPFMTFLVTMSIILLKAHFTIQNFT